MQSKTTPSSLPERSGLPFEITLLILFALLTGSMAFWAMLNLITDQGASLWFKAGLIGLAAGLVSFAVNKFAIERGAPLAAKGYLLAPMISIGSILVVGVGLFASTYAGLTINQVRELSLQEYGRELGRYILVINQQSLVAGRIVPVVDSSIADLKAKRQCEFEEGCLNARGIPGAGPTTRALTVIIDRAETIQKQMESAKSERSSLLAKLNRLLGEYQSTLGQNSKSLKVRREELVKVSSQIHQNANALSEALPLALLQSYAGELETGVNISERPVATQNVNAVLRKHAQSLNNVLGNLQNDRINPPQFPALAGVSSTFAFMGHFFPIAILTASIELVLPLALWVYTLMDRRWEIFERNTRQSPQPHPMGVKNASNSARQGKRNKTHQSISNPNRLNGSNHAAHEKRKGE